MAFSYSDGDVELQIKKVIDRQPGITSLQQYEGILGAGWAHRYHLSPVRGNLLRHLDFASLDVLELGAGIGAISRFLAEHCKWLTAVEGSQRRYSALVSRLRDLDNWDGFVSNVEDVKLDRKYDVVCIVGVLEYAELYSTRLPENKKTPAQWFLEKAASHLKDDGVLIVAIENKLGLKYWRGAPEDHDGKLYSGIVGYPLTPTPRTYSKKELCDLIRGVGLTHILDYYPFPDYKLPHTVLSGDMLRTWPELAVDITSSKSANSSDLLNAQIFPEALAARSVAKAGLLTEMANSFLFLAGRSEDSATLSRLKGGEATQGEVGWHYATERVDPIRTIFTSSDPQRLRVYKELIASKGRPTKKELAGSNGFVLQWHAVDDFVTLGCYPVRTVLMTHAYFGDWDRWWVELSEFFKWSMLHWRLQDQVSESTKEVIISGEALDASLFNALIPNEYVAMEPQSSPDRYKVFDLEYTIGPPMKMSWFILRNLYIYDQAGSSLLKAVPSGTLKDVYFKVCQSLSIESNYENDIEQEANFIAAAWSTPIENARIAVRGTLEGPQLDVQATRNPYAILDLYNGYAATVREANLEIQLDELAVVLSSRTFRIARRLRSILTGARRYLPSTVINFLIRLKNLGRR